MPDTPRGSENGRETWRVFNLQVGLREPESRLRERALAAVGLAPEAVRGFRIAHRSLDARRRGASRELHFVVHVDLVIDAGGVTAALGRAQKAGRAKLLAPPGTLHGVRLHPSLRGARVAVVGAGPAGLFAAFVLAESGVSVDLLDRGRSLGERGRAIAAFARGRVLDPENNLLYGEGGAGTYSDGKLYTRVDHELEAPILDVLVACGAPPEVRYDARAHIGTDRLHRVLPALRRRLEQGGVRFHWGVRVDGLRIEDAATRRVAALRTEAGEVACDAVILAPGHSARETLRVLQEQGVAVEAKPFQFGVRIEHPQAQIDRARHGEGPDAQLLGPAYYNLSSRAGGGASAAHSFCMCPGGQIVASVSEPGLLCTNGMSNSRHSSPYANAALVVTLGPKDFGSGTFAGTAFQRKMERRFFEAGGGDYTAPAQRACDFLAGRASQSSEIGPSSYKFGLRAARIDELLPPEVRDALRRALGHFDRAIPGFAGPEGLLVGVESRSSGPLRIPRCGVTRRATGFGNLYPVGEGAGYAGGIMSAAIDGASSARALLELGIAR